jgi:hypothetical protein
VTTSNLIGDETDLQNRLKILIRKTKVPAELHRAVMEVAPEDRGNRAKVNEPQASGSQAVKISLDALKRQNVPRRLQATGQCCLDSAHVFPAIECLA